MTKMGKLIQDSSNELFFSFLYAQVPSTLQGMPSNSPSPQTPNGDEHYPSNAPPPPLGCNSLVWSQREKAQRRKKELADRVNHAALELKRYYNLRVLEAVVKSTKTALDEIRKRVLDQCDVAEGHCNKWILKTLLFFFSSRTICIIKFCHRSHR
jgi:hypothetical protein